MTRSGLIPCLLIFFFFCTAHSQNCGSLEEWKNVILSEYPNINIKRDARSGTKLYKVIMFNLYSDKYFVPFAGKPYDEITDKGRLLRHKKIRTCHQKKKYQGDEMISWMHWSALKPFSIIRLEEPTKQKVREARQLRKEYNDLKGKIQSGQLSSNELEALAGSVGNTFDMLFPSEIARMKTLIQENLRGASDKELNALLGEIAKMNNTREDLNQLYAFSQVHGAFYRNAGSSSKQKVEAAREAKIISILEGLMSEEANKLGQIKTLEALNHYYYSFSDLYGDFERYTIVQKTKNAIRERKTSHIASNSEALGAMLSKMTDLEELSDFEELYLRNLNENNATVATVIEKYDVRKKAILDAERRKKNEFRTMLAEKDNQSSRLKSEVSQMRRNLESKYNAQLPTFEELGDILYSFLLVVKNEEGEYKVRDAEAFINRVQRFGYSRKEDGRMNYLELFTNQKGYSIAASGVLHNIGGNDREYINTSLIVPNAPKEIIELYQKELIANYRKNTSKWHTPDILPGNFDWYVDDGKYVFSLVLKEDGTLSVRAMDNLHAYLPIFAEQKGLNSVEITPWTTTTKIYLKKGQKINLRADGYIRLGMFSVDCYANGIDGFTWNNIEEKFRHGALIGKIGENSDWELVGRGTTLYAYQDGYLELLINDSIPGDNSGSFTVSFEFLD